MCHINKSENLSSASFLSEVSCENFTLTKFVMYRETTVGLVCIMDFGGIATGLDCIMDFDFGEITKEFMRMKIPS